MRISHKVILKIGDDTAFKDLLFQTDEALAEQVIDAFDGQASGKINIAASGTEALNFGDITTVKGIFIKLDGDADIDVNTLGDIPLRRATTTSGVKAKFFMEGDITSISLTNVSGTDVLTGVYCAWGNL